MLENPLTKRRHREVTRIEALSDSVFAFAATLLVVSLEVPTTVPALLAELRGFPAFGISFGALILIWAAHNAYFRRFGTRDAWTVFLNACLLFVVLFYVYPLKFLAETLVIWIFGVESPRASLRGPDDLATLFVLYGAGFVALFLIVSSLHLHAWRIRERLGLDDGASHDALVLTRHYAIFVIVGLVSVVLAAMGAGIRWGLPGFAYFLIGPLCAAHGVWSGRRRGRNTAA